MSNASKYRKKAVEYEQLKQFDRAVASYVRAIEENENASEEVDVALFNKVGDLTLRQGRVTEAVTYYERAVEHYVSNNLFDNAIALCNKILRNAPGRSNVYFSLGRICGRKGLRSDATRNFLEYATRMQQDGRVDEGMRALAEVADLMPELTEVRRLVEEHAARAGISLTRRRETPPRAVAQADAEPLRSFGLSKDLVFLEIDYDSAKPVRGKTPPPQRSVAGDVTATVATNVSANSIAAMAPVPASAIVPPAPIAAAPNTPAPIAPPPIAAAPSAAAPIASAPVAQAPIAPAITLPFPAPAQPVTARLEDLMIFDPRNSAPLPPEDVEGTSVVDGASILRPYVDPETTVVSLEDLEPTVLAPSSQETVVAADPISDILQRGVKPRVEGESDDDEPLVITQVKTQPNFPAITFDENVVALDGVESGISAKLFSEMPAELPVESAAENSGAMLAEGREARADAAEAFSHAEEVLAEVPGTPADAAEALSHAEEILDELHTDESGEYASDVSADVEFASGAQASREDIDAALEPTFELDTTSAIDANAPVEFYAHNETVFDAPSVVNTPAAAFEIPALTPDELSDIAASGDIDTAAINTSDTAEIGGVDTALIRNTDTAANATIDSAALDTVAIETAAIGTIEQQADQPVTVEPLHGFAPDEEPLVVANAEHAPSVSQLVTPDIGTYVEVRAEADVFPSLDFDAMLELSQPEFEVVADLEIEDFEATRNESNTFELVELDEMPAAELADTFESEFELPPLIFPLPADVVSALETIDLDATTVDAFEMIDERSFDDAIEAAPELVDLDFPFESNALGYEAPHNSDKFELPELPEFLNEQNFADGSLENAFDNTFDHSIENAIDNSLGSSNESNANELVFLDVSASDAPALTPIALSAVNPTPVADDLDDLFGDTDTRTAIVAAEATIVASSRCAELQSASDADPDNFVLRRRLAEALFEAGNRDAAISELGAALAGAELSNLLSVAAEIADELVRVNGDEVAHHQKRLELAIRLGDQSRLRDAYLDLADTLVRRGEDLRAKAVYARVLEIDPYDDRARTALGDAAPPAPAKPAASGSDEGHVNLADWLRDEAEPTSTRLRMREPDVSGDEQDDFNALLRHFKEGVSRSLGEDDYESHYDLGVAYKEMGLLDDAIGEFQMALRSRNNRLAAYEALGQCFLEQQSYKVAVTVLSRALHEPAIQDEQRVGILYLLGYSCEVLQRFDEARSYFQRVYATDIHFRDVAQRLADLERTVR